MDTGTNQVRLHLRSAFRSESLVTSQSQVFLAGQALPYSTSRCRRTPHEISRLVLAVESDPVSAADLEKNAAPYGEQMRVEAQAVEAFLDDKRLAMGTLLVDPPRTGLSRDVLRALVGHAARRVVYVSCDPATLARDVAAFVASGAQIESVEVFDLFPGTAHVETIVVLRHD